jgi:hypothetical protein
MSTLVAQTISNGTVSTSSENVIQGSAKAWVNFNGTTASPSTIRASYNVTSVTKNGTGQYTVNFTNAFADINYSAVFMYGTTASANTWGNIGTGFKATTGIRVFTANSASTLFDTDDVSVAIFR